MNNIKFNSKLLKENFKFVILITITVCLFLTIGFLVSDGTSDPFLPEQDNANGTINTGSLVISEIMTSNDGSYVDDEGNSHDWVEIYNGTDSDINLKNYGLSKDPNSTEWFFDNVIIRSHDYLVINLTGETRNGLFANFKLSSGGGEEVFLRKPNGSIMDAVETASIKKNWSMARDADGTWYTSSSVTPGFANTLEGRQMYLDTLYLENTTGVYINEFLPDNKGNFYIDNNFPSFIEIVNESGSAVNLADFSLSGDINMPFRSKLPEVILSPNEVFTLYLSNYKTSQSPYYDTFNLDNLDGNAILSYKNNIIQVVEYNSLANGVGMTRSGEDYFQTNIFSPGYPNTNEGIEKFAELDKAPNDLVINEVMGNNYQFLSHNGGKYYDWIELYNNSNSDINLAEYTISNNYGLADLYQLPEVTLKSGEYLTVFASGDQELTNNSYVHLNFSIGENEGIFLFKNNDLIDSVFVSSKKLGYSYSRVNSGGYDYTSAPTPNAANSTGQRDIAKIGEPSIAPGVYNDADKMYLELTGSGNIYYTTNGSNPNSSSKKYTGPITVSKTTVIKAIVGESGKYSSPVETYSYIVNENHTLPVMSLALPAGDFSSITNSPSGNAEYMTNAQYFDDTGSFDINCGIKLFGGQTRFMHKQSFALQFRKEYGEGSLKYPIFPNRDYSDFEQIVLRSSSQDYEYSMIRDTLTAELNLKYDSQAVVQDYQYFVLYVNGEYYGIYNAREKMNEHFVANVFNVDPSGSYVIRNDGEVNAGSYKPLGDIKSYINNTNMSSSAAFDHLEKELNMESFADFWVGAIYSGNNDMINYRFMSNDAYDDGRLHGVLYDMDWAFYNYSLDFIGNDMTAYSFYDGTDTIVSRGLMENSDFKEVMLDRLVYGLHNTWKTENVLAEIDRQYNLLKPEMARERARWGGTVSEWESSIDELINFVKRREGYLLDDIQYHFDLSDSKMEELFGDIS